LAFTTESTIRFIDHDALTMRFQSNMFRVFFIRALTTALFTCLLSFSAPVLAQQALRLERIQVVGLKRLTTDQVIALSGLQTGQMIDGSALDAASAKLLQSGLFRRLSYRVRSANNAATVTFEVEESAVNLPVVFENFVWFTDEELADAIRKDVPYFNGSAPANGDTTDKIAASLQRLIASRNINGTVEYLPYVSRDKQELVFAVKGAHVPVCSLRFPGASAVSEPDLVQASRELLNAEYSRKDVATFAPIKLLPLYRRIGKLRAEFQTPTVVLQSSAGCAGGVAVTIPVAEGATYRWAKSIWDGNDKLGVEELATALGMNPGDLADGIKIDQGVKNVARAYARRGHLTASVRESIEYDDAASLVTYRFTISEGPRYFMGNLIISGLAPADADSLKSKWTLGTNAVFDESYLEEFRRTSLREFMVAYGQRLRNGPRLGVSVETRPDAQKLSVDVLITIK
jgi:outer membrane protein assembly factor BamA